MGFIHGLARLSVYDPHPHRKKALTMGVAVLHPGSAAPMAAREAVKIGAAMRRLPNPTLAEPATRSGRPNA
jgi:hypothetical protein